jgi:hypothetical protein
MSGPAPESRQAGADTPPATVRNAPGACEISLPGAGRRHSAALQHGLENLQRCSAGFVQLDAVWRAGERTSMINWDNHRKVFLSASGESCARELLGPAWNIRSVMDRPGLRARLRHVRSAFSPHRKDGPFEAQASFPTDTVLLPPILDKRGLVAASYKAGLVLKIVYGREEVTREVQNWALVKEAGIEEHVPALIEHGVFSDGGQWLLTSFAPNTNPLDLPMNPFTSRERLWREWLRWKILPVLQRYYDASGVDDENVDDRLAKLEARLVERKAPEALFSILRMAKQARAESACRHVTTAMIHNDLNAGHIHRHGRDWWILDWGGAIRSIVSTELTNGYIARPVNTPERRAFWNWIGGRLSREQLPRGLRADIELYQDWYARWRKRQLDDQALRCEVLLVIGDLSTGLVRRHQLQDLSTLSSRTDMPFWIRAFGANLEALGVVAPAGSH